MEVRVFVFAILYSLCPFMYSQTKAKVRIHTFENGKQIHTEERELIVPNGMDMSEMLSKMDIWDEFGSNHSHTEYEIQIEQESLSSNNEHFKYGRAQLGVMVRKCTKRSGAEVTEILPGSNAIEAGLEIGDIIVKVDDVPIGTETQLVEFIRTKVPGDLVKVEFIRGRKKKQVKVKLTPAESDQRSKNQEGKGAPQYLFPEFKIESDSIFILRPNEQFSKDSIGIGQPFTWNQEGFEIKEMPFLGVTPGPETSLGASIGTIEPKSAAEKMGLKSGDIIVAFNDEQIRNFEMLRSAVGKRKPGDDIEVKILRDSRERILKGSLGSKSSSSSDDFRIFHNFKGMDEQGNLNYNYEFDLDSEEIEKQLEQLLKQLEQKQSQIEKKKEELQYPFKEGKSSLNYESAFDITIDEINNADLEIVNKKAEPKLNVQNTLMFERISFYPNVSEGYMQLSFVPKDQGDITVVVYDTSGNKIYYEVLSGSFGEYSNQIDLSDRPWGNYYIQILQNGNTYSKKIVKSE